MEVPPTARRGRDDEAIRSFGTAVGHQRRYRGGIRLRPAQVLALSRQPPLLEARNKGRTRIAVVAPGAHVGRVDTARPHLAVLLHAAVRDPSGCRTGHRKFLGSRAPEKSERKDGGIAEEMGMGHIVGPPESIVCGKYDLTEARPLKPRPGGTSDPGAGSGAILLATSISSYRRFEHDRSGTHLALQARHDGFPPGVDDDSGGR